MKSAIISLAILLLPIVSSAQAKRGTIEIEGGVGKHTVMDAYNSLSSRDHSVRYYHVDPMAIGGFKIYLNSDCAIGISVAHHSYKKIWYNDYAGTTNIAGEELTCVNVEMKNIYNIYNTDYFQFYNVVGAGLYIKSAWPSLYMSPLGIRVGRKNAFHLELGLGYKGLWNMGYSYRIH